jgi:predicted transcriptional regulator YheO
MWILKRRSVSGFDLWLVICGLCMICLNWEVSKNMSQNLSNLFDKSNIEIMRQMNIADHKFVLVCTLSVTLLKARPL